MKQPARAAAAIVVLSCWVAAAAPAAAQVVINEFVASNIMGLLDDHGEASDWIELHNAGSATVNLDDYGLSDDPDEPLKWTFPPQLIDPGERLLVFASGTSYRDVPIHWESVAEIGDAWRYRANTSAPPAGWQAPGFDDAGWAEGPAGFGFGDGDDATVVEPCVSVAMRRTFVVPDLAAVRRLHLHLDFDDGVVVWLNGQRIFRENLSGDGDPAWDQPADRDHEARLYRGVELDGGGIYGAPLCAGVNVLAVEVHDSGQDASDLSCVPFVTLDMRSRPADGGRPPCAVIAALLPKLHTNFKLGADGETLRLSDPAGAAVDQVFTGPMYTDVSRGRAPDGAAVWHFFTSPTPGSPNDGQGAATFAPSPYAIPAGGHYSGELQVVLGTGEPGAVVRYALGGVLPDADSPLYEGPLSITATTVVRAVTFASGKLPSRAATHTYIVDDVSDLPTTSFVTDPPNLWDPEFGIHVEANIYQEWERPVHLEFFETDGSTALSQDYGLELFGAYSRTKPQKSFKINARDGYGADMIRCRMFDEKPLLEFEDLVWRNSGNDFSSTHFRDGLMHRLVADVDLDRLAYRPSRVFLNGEYWGIMNVREHVGDYYVATNHGLDPEGIDLIKNYWTAVVGSTSHFWDLWDYLGANDMSQPAHYDHVRQQMEVENFADYQIAEIFCANTDWGTNNIAWWRPAVDGGRWRWILYDTDAGLGLQAPVEYDALGRALDAGGSGWPSANFRTHILRHLLENPDFRDLFVNRFCDHLNTTFHPQRSLALFASLADDLAAEMPRHLARWGASPDWAARLQVVGDFLTRRPAIAREHLRSRFQLGGDLVLGLDVAPHGAGRLRLSAATVDSTWSGLYFQGVPVTLTAEPAPGFVFDGWSDPELPDQATVTLTPTGDYAVTAHFTGEAGEVRVVINEINFNSSGSFDPEDWVELHNPGRAAVDLGGWKFKDGEDAHSYNIPAGTILAPGGYLVLCRDRAAFLALFPQVTTAIGNLGYGLSSGGEYLRLFEPGGELHDGVSYLPSAPWPSGANGTGATLALVDPGLDNALAANWAVSANHGTPGAANGYSVAAPDAAPELSLGAPWPNPGNPGSEIRFTLDARQQVDLVVFDLKGRAVRRLVSGQLEAGEHRRVWDGRTDGGQAAASATYVLRLQAGERVLTRKTLLVR